MAEDFWQPPDLDGTVAVVTGASRGVGRGIAEVLGQCGATVVVTARSTRDGSGREERPGSVEETAEAVTAAGGQGVPVAVDHTELAQIEALFARVREEQGGRLDLVVCNAWGGYENYDRAAFDLKFWEAPPENWAKMIDRGVRMSYLTARAAAPLLIERGRGLLLFTGAGDRGVYLGNLVYDVAKAALIRMAWGMAEELRPHGVTAIALLPGFTRTEGVMSMYGGDLSITNSTQYVGRSVVALLTDPGVDRLSGLQLRTGDVAATYGFPDTDGRFLPPFEIGGIRSDVTS